MIPFYGKNDNGFLGRMRNEMRILRFRGYTDWRKWSKIQITDQIFKKEKGHR